MTFAQLEGYEDLVQRALTLTLEGISSPAVAEILEREGYRSPRLDKRISADMVKYLLLNHADSAKQLNDPDLQKDQWRSEDLARELGIAEKQLKDWVTRGWLTAVQRPFGRTWVLYADATELQRLKQLATRQSGQGSSGPPESLRTPTQKSRKPQ